MPIQKLKDFLDERGVRYVSISHSKAFTAQEIAAKAHIPGRELAKTVMVKLDGKMAMAVLPASHRVELPKLEKLAGVKRAELATEREFVDTFPDCAPGAMPPFGRLYGMDVYSSKELEKDEEISFSAGTHTELIKLRYRDFVALAEPRIGDFSVLRR